MEDKLFQPFLLSVFLLSAWKNDLVGGAGLRQFIFHPSTPASPCPRDARPALGDLEAAGDIDVDIPPF